MLHKGEIQGSACFTHMIDMVPVKCGKTLFFDFLPTGAQNSISGSSFWPLLSTTQFLSSVQPAHSQVQPMASLSTPSPGVYSKRSWVVHLEYQGCPLSVNCRGTGLYFKEVKSWIRKLNSEKQGAKNQKVKFSHTSQGPYLSY